MLVKRRAILVTQDFHLPRAVTLCRIAGIRAWEVGDDSWRYDPSLTASLYVREVAAGLKAAYDAAFDPRPYFLGHRETGIQRVLARG
jgi:vancomycin permeability regulator SanA